MKAAILTAGCRLNQANSDLLRGRLGELGVEVVDSAAAADTCFVNTCTVTAAADRSSVQLVRRAGRSRPGTRVVVLGCLAEREPERVRCLPGVTEVWDRARTGRELAGARPTPSRSRAFLKVQDGCDRGCGFCAPGRLRGAPASVAPDRVERRFRGLLDEGFCEVVLTGLNLGLYRSGEIDLAGLVERLLAVPGRFRMRLGSLEPDTVDERLLAVCSAETVCPHFHLPLQSGDDRLLARMGRRHTAAGFRQVVERLVRARPDARVGVDVIAGLPGEGEAAFRHTCRLLDDLPVGYLHVFRFSPRPGTPAGAMVDRVPEEDKRERVALLRELSAAKAERFTARFVGTERFAVIESAGSALTDNYLRVRLGPGCGARPRELCRVRLAGNGRCLSGRVVPTGGRCNEGRPAGDQALLEVQ